MSVSAMEVMTAPLINNGVSNNRSMYTYNSELYQSAYVSNMLGNILDSNIIKYVTKHITSWVA